MKEEKLKQHGMIKSVNRTRWKQSLLEKFPHLVEEKGARDRVFQMQLVTLFQMLFLLQNRKQVFYSQLHQSFERMFVAILLLAFKDHLQRIVR